MNKSYRDKLSGDSSKIPNDFLLPWLLLLLRNSSMHGYQITQTLSIFGLATFDPATVYRTLRRLEKENLINSGWQTGDYGPAKRVYSLTDGGKEFLETWAGAMEKYQKILDRFFELYTQQWDISEKTGSENHLKPSKSEPIDKAKGS